MEASYNTSHFPLLISHPTSSQKLHTPVRQAGNGRVTQESLKNKHEKQMAYSSWKSLKAFAHYGANVTYLGQFVLTAISVVGYMPSFPQNTPQWHILSNL